MGKVRDLAGARFGKLTALEYDAEEEKWICRCDCGNEIGVKSSKLVYGETKSCGCSRKKDLVGQRFGSLAVIEDSGTRYCGGVVWRCKCDCGNEKLVSASNLVSGQTKSCGCSRKKWKKDLTGQRFEKLIAIKATEGRCGTSVIWWCKCDCGGEKLVSAHNLTGGRTKSCGCLHGKTVKKGEIVFE